MLFYSYPCVNQLQGLEPYYQDPWFYAAYGIVECCNNAVVHGILQCAVLP